MKKGTPGGYSVRKFHKDQKEILGSKAIDNYETCVGIVEDFYYGLNKAIIRDGYEYKIGGRAGYVRIAISKGGTFYWYWDKTGNYCTLPRKSLWSMDAVVGWQQPVEIGERGLKKWIVECKNDPYKSKYSVVKRFKKTKL